MTLHIVDVRLTCLINITFLILPSTAVFFHGKYRGGKSLALLPNTNLNSFVRHLPSSTSCLVNDMVTLFSLSLSDLWQK